MPGLVMDEIKPMLTDCSDKTLWCFEKDVSGWLESEYDKSMAYEREWRIFLTSVKAEIKNRKEEEKNEKGS